MSDKTFYVALLSEIFFETMYYLFYTFAWLVAWLPLWVLYVFSSFLFYPVYYVFPYRQKVVRLNLQQAFPQKNKDEIRHIEKKFYRFFCDLIVETLYLMHMSENEMKKRFDLGDISVILDQYKQGKSVLIYTAHYGNWEWGSSFSLGLPPESPIYNVYKRLRNEAFDNFMSKTRQKFGGETVEKNDLLRKMIQLKSENKLAGFAMISDQSPTRKNIRHWVTFLNQETPVILGTEQLARKFDYPVIYIHINRVKRGYYKLEYYPVSLEPQKTAEYEITEKYMQILEQKIAERPEYWLWTHKRWRHKKLTN